MPKRKTKSEKKQSSTVGKIARRSFLVGSTAIVGGAAFGFWAYKKPYGNPLKDNLAEGETALTPYVKIDQEGVTIITPRGEMGQGVQTTLACLLYTSPSPRDRTRSRMPSSA